MARNQAALDVLTGLFDRVGLHTNMNKKVGMVCQPYYIVNRQSEAACTHHITGLGRSFWERQKDRVRFPECEVELSAGSLSAHYQAQQSKEWTPPMVDTT